MSSSITATIVMQEDKRGDHARKQPLRLPIIAPKDDYSSSASSSRSGQRINTGPAVPPRARLPPRSRTGCWTCRTRKVKCDEGRPVCGQCTRLGHVCDYNPRLSFRDDTPRVVERMQDVTTAGSSIWGSQSSPSSRGVDADSRADNSPAVTDGSESAVDDLPPFASLTTDEERERKAERSSPGTYNVVVNPDSFQHLPEYTDEPEIKRERLSPLRRGSIAPSLVSSLTRDSSTEGVSVAGDPNIVLLSRFEDVSRRTTITAKDLRSPTSPIVPIPQIKQEEEEPVADVKIMVDNEGTGQDLSYLKHFRTVVWKQLVPAEIYRPIDHVIEGSSVSILEEAAAHFPPLFHAMAAVAALSMAVHDGRERLDALQHYSQALPELQNSLKTAEDLSSDGAFLTHFVLLVYEIAAAEVVHSNMWSQHLSTLLRISLLRREVFGGERYPFIVWWICNIDLNALFSGTGTGEFVGSMLHTDLVPPPSFHLYPLGADGSSIVFADELDTLPTILQLDYEVTVLATRLALLAQEFRQDTEADAADNRHRDMTIKVRQSRIYDLQESLRQLWLTPAVGVIGSQMDHLPQRSKQLFERASTMYRASIIYSHTSMWAAQRLDTSADFDTEIAVAASQILQLASHIISSGRTECRFLVFPIFMAGVACSDGNQKMLAMDLVDRMEKDSIGRNTTATRRALGIVYERQNDRFMHTGHSLDVDWMEVMVEQGLTVVNFGL